MPNFRHQIVSFRFWLVLFAATLFTIGAIRAGAASPTISIVSPTAEQTIAGTQITVDLSVTNFNLTDYRSVAKAKLGQGHIHLWLDQDNPTPTSAIKTTSPMYTFDNVKTGQHKLLVELVNNDHTHLSPAATASVSFTTIPAAHEVNASNLLFLPMLAVVLITASLVLLYPQLKTKSHSHKPTKKSAAKKSKKK